LRRWQAEGCFDAIFEGSVFRLGQDDRLDITVIHGDGTTTAAKKGGEAGPDALDVVTSPIDE
jgi:hypothetical protein